MQKPYENIAPSPCYVLEEDALEKNLKLLDYVQKESGAKILVALKGYSMFSTFDMIGKYLHGAAASGLHEARLAREEMGKEVHTFAPAFKNSEFEQILELSDHIVFNSFNQWKRFKKKAIESGKKFGIRINPEFSEVTPIIYNPCAPFSRFGVLRENFEENELDGLSGIHFHTMCEQGSDVLEKTLKAVETKFGGILHKMEWVNFGGGHHITREGYDVQRLIGLIKNFKNKYDVTVYLEPGEAIGWQTGTLVGEVIDFVKNKMDIAILDVSAATHMPDCLEMPYRPEVLGSGEAVDKKHTYRLAGPTCLAGDVIGDYSFDEPLKQGDRLIFDDMIHYTMVKNNTFNGMNLPSIAIWTKDKKLRIIKEFGYKDFKQRLS